MSWGLPEGLVDVLGTDEALYDHDPTTFTKHQGVTFVASTGDYGAADPEYPAFSAQRGGGRRHQPHAQHE